MTGGSASWRNARPFAAPRAIFILVIHGREPLTAAGDKVFQSYNSLPRDLDFEKREKREELKGRETGTAHRMWTPYVIHTCSNLSCVLPLSLFMKRCRIGYSFFLTFLVSKNHQFYSHIDQINLILVERQGLTFEEVLLQAFAAHVLVHQHPMLGFIAVTNQFHQVLMPQLPKEEHLGLHEQPKSAIQLVQVEVLDGDVPRGEPRAEAVVDSALVDGAEPAAAEVVGAGEVARRGAELGVGEGVQVRAGQRQRQVLR